MSRYPQGQKKQIGREHGSRPAVASISLTFLEVLSIQPRDNETWVAMDGTEADAVMHRAPEVGSLGVRLIFAKGVWGVIHGRSFWLDR